MVGIFLDERGEFLGSQPQRPTGAEGIGGGRMAYHGEDRGQSVEDTSVSGQLGQMELPVLVGDHVDSGKLSPAERKAMSGHCLYRLLPRSSGRPPSLHAVAPGTVRASRNAGRGGRCRLRCVHHDVTGRVRPRSAYGGQDGGCLGAERGFLLVADLRGAAHRDNRWRRSDVLTFRWARSRGLAGPPLPPLREVLCHAHG